MRFVALLLSFVAVSQGETPVPVVVSAASPSIGVTADSLASVYGDRLATKAESAAGPPWPLALGDIPGVRITDAAGKTQDVELLYVSPSQMNVHIPAGTATGPATLAFPFTGLPPGQGTAALRTVPVQIRQVAPAIFSLNGSGSGVAAASALRILPGGQLQSPVPVFQCDSKGDCTAAPIDTGLDTPVFLSLYGTGLRGASSLAGVTVTIGGLQVQPSYAGPQNQLPGLDQVNVPLPLALRGKGLVDVTVTADGVVSNAVQIRIL